MTGAACNIPMNIRLSLSLSLTNGLELDRVYLNVHIFIVVFLLS